MLATLKTVRAENYRRSFSYSVCALERADASVVILLRYAFLCFRNFFCTLFGHFMLSLSKIYINSEYTIPHFTL